MMKVVHVCASDIIGGAARATFRLHQSFRGLEDVDSSMLVRGRASDDEKVKIYIPQLFSWRHHFNISILRRAQDVYWSRFVTSNQVMHSRADIRTGLLLALNNHPCDLIHLHWLGPNTLSIEEIGQINKPVVWTLHDMWPFCGAEHYAPDGPDARFRHGYRADNRTEGETGPDMNKSVWVRKKKAWKHPMTLVCPSRWMVECARGGALFKDWPVHCIPNPLDLDRWKSFPKKYARSLLNLPQNKKVVLFGAIGGEKDPRKGADLLRSALCVLKEMSVDVHLVVFGQSKPENPKPFAFSVTYLGRLQDDSSMIAAYNSADVLLVPSRQDNLPQTAVEAQACGIPVVSFNVGGLADIVAHQRSGYLATPYDVKDFANGIALLLGDDDKRKWMSQLARQMALDKFSVPVVAKAYAALYKKVLAVN